MSRPEVLPYKQRGPSPGVFPRLGPFLYSVLFFFRSDAERWLPVFRKFFACLCRASPVERKTNSSQFAFLGNAVGARGTVCPLFGNRCRPPYFPVSFKSGREPLFAESSQKIPLKTKKKEAFAQKSERSHWLFRQRSLRRNF